MQKHFLTLIVAALGFSFAGYAQEADVKFWEGTLELPTYKVNPPETAPVFDCDFSYQRARRSVYPYAMNDNTTGECSMQSHKALFLENEYIQLCVLPDIGGRLFYALDKTNGYDIFYRNDAIKPANVGMAGAWISGGVEWNTFHHHRITSFSPCDWTIVENGDGSKTIWLGETEFRHRMHWAIGITLHPHKSYIEISGRLANMTQNSNSMLFWANAATHTNDDYQIIFPQNTEFVTFHSKDSFAHWPVTHETFTGHDGYKNNLKADWWKEHPVGNSMFVFNQPDDFIAGYDHGRQAGTMMVGNRHIVTGGKFWSWGPNSEWDSKILTDNAGHYLELMHGAYSDNQPDYNWTNPYETKAFSQYWYGIRDMGGVKKGTRQLALNMDLLPKAKLLFGANATEKLEGVTITVTRTGSDIFSLRTDIAPDAPFVESISVGKDAKLEDFTLTVTDSEGNVLLSYTPVVIDDTKALPEIVSVPPTPKEIGSIEECYLTGLRNLQFHNPFINPVDYFQEVLRRDPGETRANTQMGVYYRLRGDYDKAKKHLRTAIRRQTHDYTRPKDCEAMYNLGLVLKAEGEHEAAMDTLYRAMWSYTYNSAANTQLAQLYVAGGNDEMALDRLNEAIIYNGYNTVAMNLKASVLRQAGDVDGAKEMIARVQAFDPVNRYAAHEEMLLSGDEDEFRRLMRDNVESYIELALDYFNNGYPAAAAGLLKYIDSKTAYPTTKIWLGRLAELSGDMKAADALYQAALKLPVEYCHPFRLETLPVLEHVAELYPDNAVIQYYLGNILYDKQALHAVEHWNKCVTLEPSFAMAWRNLGWAEWKYTKNYEKAEEYYRKAISLDPQALFVEELEQIFDLANVDMKERYELAVSTHDTNVKRSFSLVAEVRSATAVGDYERSLKILRECLFPVSEGGVDLHTLYTDALLLAGDEKLAQNKLAEAVALYEEAFTYPANHLVFNLDTRTPRDAQVYWHIANAYDKSGNKAKAKLYYKKAAAVDVEGGDFRYWQALSLEKLGKTEEAKALFEGLKQSGEAGIVDSYRQFNGGVGSTGWTLEDLNTRAYYTMGLGYLGLGDREKAGECFRKSADLKCSNLWAAVMLKQL